VLFLYPIATKNIASAAAADTIAFSTNVAFFHT
jgi:hypothetical protein